MKVATKKRIRIVTDSSSDIRDLDGIEFASAPLKIITSLKQYVDDPQLDAAQMAIELSEYKGKSSTSCPNSADWLAAFGDAELIICLTITATLSGSYNSAMLAKREYEEAHPDRRVYVMNSLSTGPEMMLIAEKARELAIGDLEFEQICSELETYSSGTGLIFVLESIKNLANNGRVSPIIAKMTGILGIRLIGKASDVGDLEQLSKCRGEKKTIEATIEHLIELGYAGGKLRIAHCLNENAASTLASLLKNRFPSADISVYKCGGLCSFYAEKGGMLVGFEKNKRS